MLLHFYVKILSLYEWAREQLEVKTVVNQNFQSALGRQQILRINLWRKVKEIIVTMSKKMEATRSPSHFFTLHYIQRAVIIPALHKDV